jgi:pyruvate,water dikinase
VRQEFVVAEHIGIHPMAAVHPERLDEPTRARIEELTRNAADPAAFFVDRLAEGIGTIAAAFWPRPVIVRLGDFKSNEYRSLVGGAAFEPIEENPMIGLRGASRYLHPSFRDAFTLECRAMRRIREDMGLVNVALMVPFCRTAEEGQGVVDALAEHGLRRGENGLQVWVMCEIPSNVAAIDRFAEVFDGFSIGSNDLTQLVLGVDRDSELLAPLFRERDEAVMRTIAAAIRGAHAHGRPIGLCGQAPSDDVEFARFLVAEGIDSISLNPDAVVRATGVIASAEQSLGHSRSQ